MSLFFGYISSGKQQITNNRLLDEMYSGLRHLSHEKYSIQVEKNAGFAHLLTYGTPEDLFEIQPAYFSEQDILIVSEGRLDNRQSLSEKLGIKLNKELADGKLISLAFLKWGKESPKYLYGDWSFAVYNYREEELFIARDHHGYTAVYYHYSNDRFVFGSSAKCILSLSDFHKKINYRHFLGNLLLWESDDKSMQAYEKLCIIPPAHTLTYKNGKIELTRFWFPENIPEKNYKTKEIYSEELKEVFKEAVRARLRSYKPVTSFLSGGLDSSAVSSIAAYLLAQKGKELSTFSHVPLYKEQLLSVTRDSRVMFDETSNILATVGKARNITPFLLNSYHISPIEGVIAAVEKFDSYFHAASSAFWLVDLPEQASRMGFGSILSGEMGNGSISYTGVDYLLPFNHPSLAYYPGKRFKQLLKPCVFKYFPEYYAGKNNSLLSYIRNSYVNQEVLRDWDIENDMIRCGKEFIRYYPNAKAGMLHLLGIGENPRCQFGKIRSNEFGIDYRDPTGDVNVIEYCLSIPNDVFFNKRQESKQVIKRMMKDYLPQEILFSKRKGLQASDILYRLQNDKTNVNDLLHTLSASSKVKDYFEIQKLEKDWLKIQKSGESFSMLQIQTFVKTLMFGYFLLK
jgi:asparagine synthase (glutamine-hydrolysing)